MLCSGVFNLVISDINMPIMNGDEVVKIIRKSGQANAEIPIIAYSGDGEKEKIHKFFTKIHSNSHKLT